jgi:hypothetical protein
MLGYLQRWEKSLFIILCHTTGINNGIQDVTTTDSHFLTNELLLLMEDVPLETKHGIFAQHKVPPHFGQVTAYLNQCYENVCIGHHSPILWPPRSPDLTLLDFLLWGLIKEMTYWTKVHTRGIPALGYGWCCLHTRTPWNNSTGSKLFIGISKTVHKKPWQAFWRVIRCTIAINSSDEYSNLCFPLRTLKMP